MITVEEGYSTTAICILNLRVCHHLDLNILKSISFVLSQTYQYHIRNEALSNVQNIYFQNNKYIKETYVYGEDI